MQKALFFLLIVLISYGLSRPGSSRNKVRGEMPVAEVLEQLGDPPLPHKPDTGLAGVSVARGRDLVTKGNPAAPGGEVSRHFTCLACHNVQRDEPTLSYDNPQERLDYVVKKDLPFLPGTALYGAVNRTAFYNGDYEKKYGDLVENARHSLRGAIQLCAVECSQGRPLNTVEMESVLAYLWTIGLKMDDLKLNEQQIENVEAALAGHGDKTEAARLIKSRYATEAPATFVTPPEDRKTGYPVEQADPANGQLIYERSCLHCHENKRYAFFRLDESRFSHRHLQKHIPRYTRYSIYQVMRYGTSPIPGKRAYMPN